MAQGRMQVSVRDLPEVLFEIRRELARVLRDEAGSEADPAVAKRLREVADQFETGASASDRKWDRMQATRRKKKGDGR